MNSYSEISSVASNALMSALFWGVAYFIVLFVPLYIYLRKFSKEEQNNSTPFFEMVGQALILQIGALIVFAIIGTFIQTVNIGNNDLKPKNGYTIFFGNGSELIDARWGNYLSQFMNDSAAQTSFGNEAKGVAFLAIKYVGILYRIFIMVLFFLFVFYILVIYFRQFREGEQQTNTFSRMFSTFLTTIAFVFTVEIHSIVASSLPIYFGIPSDAKAINFINYFQSVIADLFYTI